MARRKDEEGEEINEGLGIYQEEQIEAKFESDQVRFAEEFKNINGLKFVWDEQKADPDEASSIERAFTLTGNENFWKKYQSWGIEDYVYISDEPTIGRADSRALSNKYIDERKFLNPGDTYYLNQI